MPTDLTNLDPEQIAFVRLHHLGNDFVQTWRHLFQGSMIRVETAKGRRVTLATSAVDALVAAGLMTPGWGGSFVLTEKGREL